MARGELEVKAIVIKMFCHLDTKMSDQILAKREWKARVVAKEWNKSYKREP